MKIRYPLLIASLFIATVSTAQSSKYPPVGSSGGGSGITTINGDSTPAQVIAAGTGISIVSAGGTTTVTNNEPGGIAIGQGIIGGAPYANLSEDALGNLLATFTQYDSAGFESIDWTNRQLIASDGSTVDANWANPNQFLLGPASADGNSILQVVKRADFAPVYDSNSLIQFRSNTVATNIWFDTAPGATNATFGFANNGSITQALEYDATRIQLGLSGNGNYGYPDTFYIDQSYNSYFAGPLYTFTENYPSANVSSKSVDLGTRELFAGDGSTVGLNWNTPGVIYTLAQGGFGTTTPSAQYQFVTADDTNPSYVTSWDSRHTFFGLPGGQGAGVGFSNSSSTNTENIIFLAPDIAWQNANFEAETFSFMSSGDTQGIYQDHFGHVGLNGVNTPREVLEVNGSAIVNGTINDNSDVTAADVNNRELFASDGTTLVLNFSTKQTSHGTTTGFAAATGTPVLSGSTFTGGLGSTAYTLGDIVLALKTYGLLAQ